MELYKILQRWWSKELLNSKSRVNRIHKAVVRALPVQIKARAVAIVIIITKARAKAKAKTRIKAILYRPKDFVRVHISKAIRVHYRHLSNSNLNLLITFFLTRKLYTGSDVTRNVII